LRSVVAPGSRQAVADFLRERLNDAAPCLVGLDFAFAFPAWFAAANGWANANAIWDAAAAHGEHWLRDCAAPFWGRPGVPRSHEHAMGERLTEREYTGTLQPKSVFQIGGAGSVGTGSIRGMPMLRALRDLGWSVWPFDPLSSHTLVEIYPRLFTGPVVKRSREARAVFLAESFPPVSTALRLFMTESEDAFDAGVSAQRMSVAFPRALWPAITNSEMQIEGAIWDPDRVR
jgi:hypothetical protein